MPKVPAAVSSADFSQGWVNIVNDVSAATTDPQSKIKDIENMRMLPDRSLVRRKGIRPVSAGITFAARNQAQPFNLVNGVRKETDQNLRVKLVNLSTLSGYEPVLLVTSYNRVYLVDIENNLDLATTPNTLTVQTGQWRNRVIAAYKDGVVTPDLTVFKRINNFTEGTGVSVNPEVRDFWGEPLEVGQTIETFITTTPIPGGLYYILVNSGWTPTNFNAYQTSQSKWPALNQVWFVGKNSTGNFDPPLLNQTDFMSTRAPIGRVIIEFSERSDTRVAQLAALYPSDSPPGTLTEDTLSSTSSFYRIAVNFGQRVAWGGLTNQGTLSSTAPAAAETVLISRILSNEEDISKCYQVADPTSEHDSQLVDDDGLIIQLTGCGEINNMVSAADSLICFCSNGIWQISGADGTYFTATSFRVNRISEERFEDFSPAHVIGTDIFCPNKSGLLVLSLSTEDGLYRAQDLNTQILGDYKVGLTNAQLREIRMAYDEVEKELHIGYPDPSYPDRPYINEELILNFNSRAFYKYTYNMEQTGSDDATFCVKDFVYIPEQGFIYVLISDYTTYIDDTITTGDNQFYFGRMDSADFRDLGTKINSSTLGANSEAFVEFWPQTLGRDDVVKEAPYILSRLQRTETGYVDNGSGLEYDFPSGCKVSYAWDWKGTFSTPKNCYVLKLLELPTGVGTYNFPYDVVHQRNKVRGWGHALSVKYSSEDQKDMNLLGYTIKYLANDSI